MKNTTYLSETPNDAAIILSNIYLPKMKNLFKELADYDMGNFPLNFPSKIKKFNCI